MRQRQAATIEETGTSLGSTCGFSEESANHVAYAKTRAKMK